MPHELSDEEKEAMRTPESWMNFVACRLRDAEVARKSNAEKLALGDARMGRIEMHMQKNSDSIESMVGKVDEMFGILTTMKGGGTLLSWVGHAAKWAGGIAVAWTAIRSAMHGALKLPWQ